MKKLSSLIVIAALINAPLSAQVGPPPSGPFAVGRAMLDWVDDSRADPENEKGRREVVVWLWYPAHVDEKAGAQPAEWIPGQWGDLFAASDSVSLVAAGQTNILRQRPPLRSIRVASFANAPFALGAEKFPVLVFAPGFGPLPLSYSNLIEDLVSRGYIVAGVVPTYLSSFTVFADGRIAGHHPAPMEIPGGPRSSGEAFPDPFFRLFVGDIRFAVEQLVRLNSDKQSIVHGRLDLDRIGAFGHSLGAPAVASAARDDARIRATVLLDGTLVGDLLRRPSLAKPLMYIASGAGLSKASANVGAATQEARIALVRSGTPGYDLAIRMSPHMFPSDFGVSPMAPLSAPPGLTPPVRSLAITKAYIAAFFDQYLKGKQSSLLNGPSPDYPEVVFNGGR